jgi:hypothetical protein
MDDHVNLLGEGFVQLFLRIEAQIKPSSPLWLSPPGETKHRMRRKR